MLMQMREAIGRDPEIAAVLRNNSAGYVSNADWVEVLGECAGKQNLIACCIC